MDSLPRHFNSSDPRHVLALRGPGGPGGRPAGHGQALEGAQKLKEVLEWDLKSRRLLKAGQPQDLEPVLSSHRPRPGILS